MSETGIAAHERTFPSASGVSPATCPSIIFTRQLPHRRLPPQGAESITPLLANASKMVSPAEALQKNELFCRNIFIFVNDNFAALQSQQYNVEAAVSGAMAPF
jgi:hypothetical protein